MQQGPAQRGDMRFEKFFINAMTTISAVVFLYLPETKVAAIAVLVTAASSAAKLAMLHDWGSWGSEFNAVTASVRKRLLAIVHGQLSPVVVPLQGSGTFSVEAAVATLVPRDGHVLVLDNGAYCKRAGKLTQMRGRRVSVVGFAADAPVCPTVLDEHLRADASISHVVLIHCETGAGVENPLAAVAAVCERRGKGEMAIATPATV